MLIRGSCSVPKEDALHPAAIAVITLFSAFTIVIIISAVCCIWGTCRKHKDEDLESSKRTAITTDLNCYDDAQAHPRYRGNLTDKADDPSGRPMLGVREHERYYDYYDDDALHYEQYENEGYPMHTSRVYYEPVERGSRISGNAKATQNNPSKGKGNQRNSTDSNPSPRQTAGVVHWSKDMQKADIRLPPLHYDHTES